MIEKTWIKQEGQYGKTWVRVIPAHVKRVEYTTEGDLLVCNFGENDYSVIKCGSEKNAKDAVKNIMENGDSKVAIEIKISAPQKAKKCKE